MAAFSIGTGSAGEPRGFLEVERRLQAAARGAVHAAPMKTSGSCAPLRNAVSTPPSTP
jgi:hypothetical protein